VGGGITNFKLSSDAANTSKSIARSAAGEFSIEGQLDDGAMTFRLRGSYNADTGKWTASARSSMIIFTLEGAVDEANNSMGSTATIAVKSGEDWIPHFFVIDEGPAVISSPLQTEVPGGIPDMGLGWWRASGREVIPGYGTWSYQINALISPWKMSATVTGTTPDGPFSEKMDIIIVEIPGNPSGVGPYRVFYTYPDFMKTHTTFAQAVQDFVKGTPTVIGLSDFPDGNPNQGRWVVVGGDGEGWGPGFTNSQIQGFYNQNHWNVWASNNSIPVQSMFGAVEVEYNRASNATRFDMFYLAVEGSPWYMYEWEFSSLADLRAANLVREHQYNDGSKGPVFREVFSRP
jgi:hypothetical protein